MTGSGYAYRQAMEIDTNQTEATMQPVILSNPITHRYGYQPQVMFAATRAGAERRARETAAAAALNTRASRSVGHLVNRFVSRYTASKS